MPYKAHKYLKSAAKMLTTRDEYIVEIICTPNKFKLMAIANIASLRLFPLIMLNSILKER